MTRLVTTLVIIALNLTIGTMAVRYDVWILLGRTISLGAGLLIGLVAGQVAVPLEAVFGGATDAVRRCVERMAAVWGPQPERVPA